MRHQEQCVFVYTHSKTLSKDELGKNLIYTCSFEKMTDNAYALPYTSVNIFQTWLRQSESSQSLCHRGLICKGAAGFWVVQVRRAS